METVTDPRERRKHKRINFMAHIFFNVLHNSNEYMRGESAILKKLVDIDNIALIKNEDRSVLGQISKKLSMVIAMLGEKKYRKNYTYQGVLLNISISGLSFAFAENIPIGAFFELGFEIDGKFIDASGRVAFSKTKEHKSGKRIFMVGVEFTSVLDEDRAIIEKYVNDNEAFEDIEN